MNSKDGLKEIVTTLIALAVTGLAIWMLAETFTSASGTDPDLQFERRKDILIIVTGLLGTVIGYYFGRVPAEKRADKAEQEVKETREELKEASVASENLRQLRPVLEQVDSALSSQTARTLEAIGPAEQERLEARQNLDFILKRLNWK